MKDRMIVLTEATEDFRVEFVEHIGTYSYNAISAEFRKIFHSMEHFWMDQAGHRIRAKTALMCLSSISHYGENITPAEKDRCEHLINSFSKLAETIQGEPKKVSKRIGKVLDWIEDFRVISVKQQ